MAARLAGSPHPGWRRGACHPGADDPLRVVPEVRITVIWLGRNRITGIEPGRVLTVEGMLSQQGVRKIMYNPRYDLGTDAARGPVPGS